jgi:mannose-6-phosphate isomerase-like protein (cupin superfamily)
MRQITISTGHFSSEADAMARAEEAGLFPLALDFEPSGEDHWHDFGATVYVIEGSVKITDVASGSSFEVAAGCSITAEPGAVHREEGLPYRAVVALDRDPTTLTMPIDKSPADHPSSLSG